MRLAAAVLAAPTAAACPATTADSAAAMRRAVVPLARFAAATVCPAATTARFVAAAKERGFDARPGQTFWHFSSGCDAGRAVRSLTKLFRDATRIKLRAVGIGPAFQDLPWLRAVDQAVLLGGPQANSDRPDTIRPENSTPVNAPGPAGWNASILNLIS